jgi:hypothetical protein
MSPRLPPTTVRDYLRGTLLLCAVFFGVGIAGALIGASLGFAPKRVSMAAISGVAFLFAAQPPAWLNAWRNALGEGRARTVLVLTGLVALLLALFAPLAWITTLIKRDN